MKRILIVEDKLENMNAAKAFFSTVPGFKFIYASNRKQAEVYLNDAYAIITDRDIPFEDRATEGDWTPQEGYTLCVYAKSLGKKVIIISQHGHLCIFSPNVEHADFVGAVQVARASFGQSASKDIMKYAHRGDALISIVFGFDNDELCILHGVYDTNDYSKIPKSSQKSWNLAWQELNKQF